MRQLTLHADQAEYDAWHRERMRRVNDPDDSYLYVDLNDSIMVFVTAMELHRRYPRARAALEEHAPEIIERAATELGMFGGVAALANAAGLPVDTAESTLIAQFR